MSSCRALALDDRGVVLVRGHAARLAEHGQGDAVELEAEFLGDHLAAGQDGDVLQHGLAAVAEAGGLDGQGLEGAAQLVDHQGGQRLAVDILGDDHQVLLAGLHQLLQHGQDVGDRADLLIGDQDVGVLQHGFHALGIGDHVGRDIAAVELHAVDVVPLKGQALGLLDGDHAVFADLLHHLGDQLADSDPGWTIAAS